MFGPECEVSLDLNVRTGRRAEDYATWIRKADSWGGAIECRILAAHYKCVICCVDCQTLNVYSFGEDGAMRVCV